MPDDRPIVSCDSHILEVPEIFDGLQERFGDDAPGIFHDPERGEVLNLGGGSTYNLTVGRFGIAGHWANDPATQEMIRQGMAPREQIIFLSLINVMQSDVDMTRSTAVHPHDRRVWHVTAEHGYLQEPRATEILDRAVEISGGGIAPRSSETFFVLPRELIVEYTGSGFARWRRILYGVLARNQSYAPDYFYIPHSQLMEFTWVMEA